MQRLMRAGSLCLFAILVSSTAAKASFHFYDISEVYSSADGSVQFVEMFTQINNQQFLDGQRILAFEQGTFFANTFTFVGVGPSPTANRNLLIATASFEEACGIVPDYILPDGFLFEQNGGVSFGPNVDTVTYTSLPLDWVTSLNFPGGATGTNSPKNHAGDTCSLVVPAATPDFVPALGPWGVAVVVALLSILGSGRLRRRTGEPIVHSVRAQRQERRPEILSECVPE